MKYLHACVYFYIYYKYAQHTYIYDVNKNLPTFFFVSEI